MLFTENILKVKAHIKRRIKSDYFSLTGGSISIYDDLIKESAKTIGWDWRLLASLIYQESQISPLIEHLGLGQKD